MLLSAMAAAMVVTPSNSSLAAGNTCCKTWVCAGDGVVKFVLLERILA